MEEGTTREKLTRLAELHQRRVQLQAEEEALAAELATSGVRGVRTAMARALDVTLEALRLRYGPVRSVADAGQEPEQHRQTVTD
ncbi:hypothetical protein ACFVY4_26685 [Streptomyces sp. NPDC058299]|uniref:hypothetical protein n=1 Tax=Streptomyces sp. NPDC058299 TaxID=3346435 RepID=UPI0036EE08B2